MENMNQKVYINPNFNRTGTHLNKHFPHTVNAQTNNRKIFVNPNFLPVKENNQNYVYNYQYMPQNIQSNFSGGNSYYTPQTVPKALSYNTQQYYVKPSHTPTINCTTYNYEQNYQQKPNLANRNLIQISTNQNFVNENKVIDAPIVKSRYTLVRNNKTNEHSPKDQITTQVKQVVNKDNPTNYQTLPKTNYMPGKKSRYCLIRNKDHSTISNSPVVKRINTIKVSKYKIVPLSNIKRDVHTIRDVRNKFILQVGKPKVTLPRTMSFSPLLKTPLNRSAYKYRKLDVSCKKLNLSKNIKLVSPVIKRSVNHTQTPRSVKQNKNKSFTRKYKINNIPCPLFIKYGKCLRKSNSNCEYLHDKKHVSLCRKFLKGICHNTDCLLSHELSAKKMPTCYFYLKGMCTKENCPYLHVKLSSKSKICQDFLKGYCEKGEKCLERHVQKPSSTKGMTDKKTKSPNKPVKKLKDNPKASEKKCDIVKDEVNVDAQKPESDHRYYKEIAVDDDQNCEVIKPLRCKLGILPSYIQL